MPLEHLLQDTSSSQPSRVAVLESKLAQQEQHMHRWALNLGQRFDQLRIQLDEIPRLRQEVQRLRDANEALVRQLADARTPGHTAGP